MNYKFRTTKEYNPLILTFLVVGFGETVAQVLVIRELILNFQGNELSIGIILANWMLMVALGSWGLGKITEKLHTRLIFFIITLLAFCIFLPGSLLIARAINHLLGLRIGEIVGIFPIFYSSLLVVGPVALLNGFQFALGCRIISENAYKKESGVAKVYITEAIGCMVGGIFFTFFLIRYFHTFEVVAITIILNLFAAIILVRPWVIFKKSKTNPSKLILIPVMIFLIICVYFLSSGSISDLNEISSKWQWQGQNLIYHKDSVYGNISVTQSNSQINFFNNGLLMFSVPYSNLYFLEEIIHFPLLYHPHPERVLLVGGGVGGAVREILKHPVSEVDYIELDPMVVKTTRDFINDKSLDDPRLKVYYSDSRFYIKSSNKKYDVIIINLPPPYTLQLNRFYTKEFFIQAKSILNSRGIFSFSIPSSEAYMSQDMLRHNRSIYETVKKVFPALQVIPGEQNLFLASNNPQILEIDIGLINNRFLERKLDTDLLTVPYIEYKLDTKKISDLLSVYTEENFVKTNEDFQPVGTFYNLAIWNVMFYPKIRNFFNWLTGVRLWWFAAPLSIFMVIFILLSWYRRQIKIRYSPIVLSIATSGFAGMTLNIVILFSYQILFGYLYRRIGILVASFMLGLALGGFIMNKIMKVSNKSIKVLGCIEGLFALYSFFLYYLLVVLFSKLWNFQIIGLSDFPFSLLNCFTGFLVGLEFPLAIKIFIETDKRVGYVAGTFYASDLAGAICGSVLTGFLLISVLGIQNTCILVSFLKLISLILIINLLVLRLKSKLFH